MTVPTLDAAMRSMVGRGAYGVSSEFLRRSLVATKSFRTHRPCSHGRKKFQKIVPPLLERSWLLLGRRAIFIAQSNPEKLGPRFFGGGRVLKSA